MFDFIIGAGQGGSRLARVVATTFETDAAFFNLAGVDFSKFEAPRNRVLVIDAGGTGKDPEYGESVVRKNIKQVRDFLKGVDNFKRAEKVLIVVGGGGGSGSGFLFPLLDMYCQYKQIVILYTFPLKSEGVPTKPNALKSLNRVVDYVNEGVSLIPVDNQHCMDVREEKRSRDESNSYWGLVNTYVSDALKWHWYLTTLENHKNYYDLSLGYKALDSNDLRRLIFGGGGLIDFREAIIEAPNQLGEVEKQIKGSGLLFEGLDLKSAKRYAVTISIPHKWKRFERGLGVFMDAIFDTVRKAGSNTPDVVRCSFYNKKFQRVRIRVVASGLAIDGPGVRKMVRSMQKDLSKLDSIGSAGKIDLGI